MQPSKPVRTFSDAELLARSHRRRRWIARIALGSLLVLLLFGLGGLALTSYGMSIEEAEAACKRLNSENVTVSKVESVLGKPVFHLEEESGFKISGWFFTKSSFDTIEIFVVRMGTTRNDESAFLEPVKSTCTGRDAWRFRWRMLKWRLGFNAD